MGEEGEGWGGGGGWGWEGAGGGGGGGWGWMEGGWVIYHLRGCVLPPPARAEKTHNKHSQDTELMDDWPAKFFRKRKDSFIIIDQIFRKLEKAKEFFSVHVYVTCFMCTFFIKSIKS